MTDVFAQKYCQAGKAKYIYENTNEWRDVLGDSRKSYRCPWAEIGNTDRVKNQSDCRIRYRAIWKKKKKKKKIFLHKYETDGFLFFVFYQIIYGVAHNCHGKRKKHHGKRNNVKEKHKSVSNYFCAVEMINKYDFYQ